MVGINNRVANWKLEAVFNSFLDSINSKLEVVEYGMIDLFNFLYLVLILKNCISVFTAGTLCGCLQSL